MRGIVCGSTTNNEARLRVTATKTFSCGFPQSAHGGYERLPIKSKIEGSGRLTHNGLPRSKPPILEDYHGA